MGGSYSMCEGIDEMVCMYARKTESIGPDMPRAEENTGGIRGGTQALGSSRWVGVQKQNMGWGCTEVDEIRSEARHEKSPGDVAMKQQDHIGWVPVGGWVGARTERPLHSTDW